MRMRKFFWMMMAIPGLAVADSVHQSRSGREVVIKFDEPVVPLSVVQNSYNDKADAAAKGLNLFDVTGCDAQFLPEARWLDQDRLQLTYRKGFEGNTVFRVAFRPGADKYLSGAKMPQNSFEFSCKALEPASMQVNAGLPRAATCVYVPNPLTKAQLAFSPSSPVTYVFREVVNSRLPRHDSKRYGRTVPGVASPALVRHVPARRALELLARDLKPGEQQTALEKMTLDTPLPGHVLVQAADVLPGKNDWELVADADVGSDLVENTFYVSAAEPLRLAVGSSVSGVAGKEEIRLQMRFNAPVFKSEIAGIFRNLEMKVGDAVAVNSEDGSSKTLTLPDGKSLTFTLQKPQRELVDYRMTMPYPANGENENTKSYSYNPPYTDAFEVVVSGNASLPQLLDVVLPPGTSSMLGAGNAEPERVRISLTPAWPQLSGRTDMESPVLLPLKGEHKLNLTALNYSNLQVSAARLTPEQFLEYADTLCKHNFYAQERLAVGLYDLAILRTRRGISGMEVTDSEIRNAESRVRHLRRNVVDLEALRARLKGVNFLAPQKLDTTTEAQPGLGRTPVTLDLDALVGGKAIPGYYIISVRTEPSAEVKEQLRRVGANPADFASEQWYPVLLSDLNVIEGTGALALTRLSDGTPVVQGQLLQQSAEPMALQHGVAVVPRAAKVRQRREQRWLVLQSGEDYRPVLWRDESVRLEDDSRLELVRDRGTYRPGETVHMRGVLRLVSPQGQASVPYDRIVTFSVNRPNGTQLLEKNLKVNEYGAFEIDFTLPDGDEDVTGSYRVLAHKGNFRAYEYISCEVFRRDSFEVKSELTMQPIRPSEYSLKVTATDLNGTPLSGGKLTFQTQVVQNQKRSDETHKLTLGEDGTATFTAKLPELQPDEVNNYVSIQGQVSNDREEVLRLPGCSQAFYPADFTGELKDNDILLLNKVVAPGQKAGVLERAQTVHLRLLSRLPREHELSNGIVIRDSVKLPLWEGDITVPANAVNGVPTGMKERWQRFADSLNKDERHANPPMIVEMTGTDADGRRIKQMLSSYVIRSWGNQGEHRPITGTVEGNNLKLRAAFTRSGLVLPILRSVLGTRALPPVQVQEGMNELAFPLAAGEVGNVQVSLLLPMPQDGLYKGLESASLMQVVPNTAATLKTVLNLPQQAVRPGEKIRLGGTVTGPDGKPAAAQVTLFAVDAGMLSVDKYRVPNLLDAFTRVWVDAFSPRVKNLPMLRALTEMDSPHLMNGIWTGRWLDAQGRIIKRPAIPYRGANSARNSTLTMGSARLMKNSARAVAGDVEADYCLAVEESAEPMSMEAAPAPSPSMAPTAAKGAMPENGVDGAAAPRLRTNFIPVAVWCPGLTTDADGNFTTEVTLPDTLTTYKVFALSLGRDGKTFGDAEGEFTVNQPLMLTPGTPLFMSTGDCLRLPLTITNASDADGTWMVLLEGSNSLQKVTLKAKSTATLYFDYTAVEEGERKLRWKAVSPAGGDAVEGIFSVRFPAPLLKEAHHLVLTEGKEALKVATLLAPELAGSTRGALEILLSANPLLHLYGCMELVQNTPYPCTQYNATSLLVWMLYDRLAPFSPIMAQTEPAAARRYVTTGIAELLKCQQQDGGISFWCGARQSSPWASAYVGLVLTLAGEQGFDVPAPAMARLKDYLRKQLELSRQPEPSVSFSPFDLYAIGRTIGDRKTADDALAVALKSAEKNSAEAAIFAPVQTCCWWRTSYAVASLRFLAEMSRDKTDIHADFLKWMRAVGHDYRHATHWDGGWMLLALHEYLRRTPGSNAQATLTLQDGQQLTLGQGMTTISPAAVTTLGQIPTTLTPVAGTAYLTVKAKALPEKTDYPGVTEKGLQITRIYEKRGADGVWREAREFNVGDVVRVTLTCAKSERELEYFVLEDYLPACMEAINPNVPSQAAGLEWRPWSHWFDHKEYLSYRVRGFCTRWGGRDLLNMSYFARVKRAGTSTAPPAQGQLMYEPQTYGLSPNAVIISR